MSFDAGKIEGTIDLDRSPFQREISAAKTEARQFTEGKYSAKLDADTRQADAKIIDIRTRLERLSTDRATPKIDLDGFTEAEARIKLLQAQLDKLSRTRVTPSIGGAGGGLGSSSGGRGGFFAPGGLAGLAVFGAPAAVPLGVAGLGLGASLLTPTLAGGLGLGLFGGASKAAFSRVGKAETQLTAINRRIANTPQTTTTGGAASAAQLQAAQLRLAQARVSGSPLSILQAQNSLNALQSRGATTQANPEYDRLVKQRQQLLNQLTPAERKAAEETERFEQEWKRFQRALEPESFKLLATGTDIFRKGLHLLLPMTKAVGDEVDHLAHRADSALSQPFWKQFFGDFLAREAPRAVDTLGTVLGNVITGFAHLSEDFAPLGHRLEDDVVRWSGIFDRWTQGSGPQKFVQLVERDGPIAAKALEALAHGLGGLAIGLEPIGRIELQALTPVLQFIGDLGHQHPGVITALGLAYITVATGLKAIAAAENIKKTLDNATLGLAGLRRGALLTAGAIGTVEIGKHSGNATEATLGGALTGLATGLLTFGPEGAVVGAFAGGVLSLGSWIASARGAVQSLTTDVNALATSLENAIQADKGLLGGSVQRQIKQLLLSSPEFQKPGKYGHTLLETLSKYGVSIGDLINRAQGGYPADYAAMINAAIKSGNKELINQSTDLILAIQQALRDYQALGNISGGSGGGKKHGGSKGGSGSTPDLTGGSGSLGQQGTQGGLDYSGGVASGITAGLPKVDLAIAQLSQRISSRLQIAQSKLKADISARASLQQSLVGSLIGGADLSNAVVNGRVGNLSGFLNLTMKPLDRLDQDVAKLSHRHLDPYYLQQIVNAGPVAGLALAENILSGRSGSIAHLDRLDKRLHSLARHTAIGLAGSVYDDQIAQDRAHVRELVIASHASNKLLKELLDAVKANPHDFAAAIDSVFSTANHKHHSRTSH